MPVTNSILSQQKKSSIFFRFAFRFLLSMKKLLTFFYERWYNSYYKSAYEGELLTSFSCCKFVMQFRALKIVVCAGKGLT